MEIKERAQQLQDQIAALRHEFHRHPELGMNEFRTTDRIAAQLEEWGIPYRRFDPTGLLATIEGGAGGPTVALRADIDALPIQEETGLPFASEVPGCMHACGHDTHAAMLLGAARILWERRAELTGTVRLLFQPAEETVTGARHVIAQGAADGVDVFFGIHITPDEPVGSIGCQPGASMAASARFSIRVHGNATHGASPHEGIDATVAASAIVLALQTIVSRRTDPQGALVVTVGQLHSGTTFNIVSGEAYLEGTCRYFDRELGERVPDQLRSVAEGVAAGYGATVDIEFERTTDVVVNDDRIRAVGLESAKKVLPSPELTMECRPTMGSEDFGEYAVRVPSAFFTLGAGGNGPGHNNRFRVEDGALHTGAALYAQFAVDMLEELAK